LSSPVERKRQVGATMCCNVPATLKFGKHIQNIIHNNKFMFYAACLAEDCEEFTQPSISVAYSVVGCKECSNMLGDRKMDRKGGQENDENQIYTFINIVFDNHLVLVAIEERIGHGHVARNAAPNRAVPHVPPHPIAAAANRCPHPCSNLIDILPDNDTNTSRHYS
jgi:hypothetical protein